MPTQTTYHHGALRDELVTAALAMVETGEALTLRGVARSAGVSHAAPYHHFTDRRDLVAAVAAVGMKRLTGAVEEAARGAGSDPRKQLLEAGVAYVRFAIEHGPLFRLIFSPLLADRSDLPDLQRAHDAAAVALGEMVRGRLGADATGEEVRFWALRGWSTAHGLANLVLDDQLHGLSSSAEAEQLVRRVFLADLARPGR